MTAAEQRRCKAILKVLHDADGGQHDELTLHAQADPREHMTFAEFTAALSLCDTGGWITGVTSRHNQRRKLWNINDAGEAALLQL